MERGKQVLSACGWQINTAFGERLNLSRRQRGAALRRRSATSCERAEGWGQPLALCQGDHHVGLPHASLRQARAEPLPTHGSGAAKVGRPCTPAMAAGVTDHVWSLTEGLCSRVPPWPQMQTVSNRRLVQDWGIKGGPCVQIQTTRGKSEVDNRLGRLGTGWLRRHRGLERGPKIISAGLRYATHPRPA